MTDTKKNTPKVVWQLLFFVSLLVILWFIWSQNTAGNNTSVSLPFIKKMAALPLPELIKNRPETAYTHAIDKATKLKILFLSQKYEEVENFIETERKPGYTPWDIRSWIDFYIKQLKDNPENAVFEIEVPRANDWVEHSPNSTYSHTFRGQVFYDLAWQARGNKFSRETPKHSVKEFAQYLELSKIDFKRALEIDPSNDFAWMYMILINRQHSGVSDNDFKTFQNALDQVPSSYRVYNSFLIALQPKWGGSNRLMSSYVKNYTDIKKQYPALAQLASTVHKFKAQQIARKRSKLDKQLAAKKKDQSTYWKHFYEYFENETIWNKYSSGYQTVFDSHPNYAEGLHDFAEVAKGSGRTELAINYYERAMKADAPFLGADKIYFFAKYLVVPEEYLSP
ncbi:MAG: hypothetical protein COC05_05850 [Gammaproteobacteria bacterium]|nr:hypothetical protein [bacterium AH-315-E07]PCH59854.1 MAG: hypothetical protein COC05_05850 [Gammaproteobacteria bacterium]